MAILYFILTLPKQKSSSKLEGCEARIVKCKVLKKQGSDLRLEECQAYGSSTAHGVVCRESVGSAEQPLIFDRISEENNIWELKRGMKWRHFNEDRQGYTLDMAAA